MLSHFSLFSGIGGIDLAAEWAGFKTVGMCEIDKFCQQVLDKHWPDVPKWGDVFELTGKEIIETCGEIDLLSGGFPCQPFSTAGKRQGEKDERYLWPEMLRIIREVRPRWILGENVRGLLSIDNNRIFGTILKDLAESGYRVGWLCYGAGDVGAPHRRERVFIVAYSQGSRWDSKAQSEMDEEANKGKQGCGFNNGCKDVAHSGRELPPGAKFGKADEMEAGREMADQHKRSSKTRKTVMENPGGRGFGKQDICSKQQGGAKAISNGTMLTRSKCKGRAGRAKPADGGKRAVESGVGGVLNGFSAGLDGHRWPAGPGEQYDWEPPRVATGVKDRVARLKALGNAVVPAQVYPILKAIAETEKEAD